LSNNTVLSSFWLHGEQDLSNNTVMSIKTPLHY